MNTISGLPALRRAFMPLMLAGLVLLYAAAVLTAWLTGNGFVAVAVVGGAPIGLALASARLSGAETGTRQVSSAALMTLVGLLVYATAGTHLQIDMHMVFFAALAVVAGWCCWSSILTATAVVAVHHLALNLLYPAAVFPNGAEYTRVVLHAGVLLVEAGALTLAARQLARALSASALAAAEASASAELARELGAAQATESEAKLRRMDALGELTRAFERDASSLAQGLAGAAAEMEAAARSMAATAEETTQQTFAAAGSTVQTSANVQTVAAASKEMAAAVLEIAQRVGQSTGVAQQAVERARRTDATVRRLAATADRIGTVV